MKIYDGSYTRDFFPFIASDTPNSKISGSSISVFHNAQMEDFGRVVFNVFVQNLSPEQWEEFKAAGDAAFEYANKIKTEEAAKK